MAGGVGDQYEEIQVGGGMVLETNMRRYRWAGDGVGD